MFDWGVFGYTTLVFVLLIFVGTGAVPVLAGAMSFLVIPVHAVKNHYRKAAPYLPRVSIVIPAWNEGAVVGESIDRLMALQYPPESLRVYVVDDASTDDTPDVVLAKADQYPGRVFHIRRDKGGEGKAHTLNAGIRVILEDDWMQALLIMDADVIYLPDSLRKMTRHLADPQVGAVSAYIREGSADKNYLTRFIGFEYVLSQPAARRAQNVLGAQACLAGGAQLHTRENLIALGGRIDTSTLAEDTITTFETQLRGREVVFEPLAIVLSEEPGEIAALWKQRLRWARGNVTVTARYRKIWFRPSKVHHLGGWPVRHRLVQPVAAARRDGDLIDRPGRPASAAQPAGDHRVPLAVDQRRGDLRLHSRHRGPARPQTQRALVARGGAVSRGHLDDRHAHRVLPEPHRGRHPRRCSAST